MSDALAMLLSAVVGGAIGVFGTYFGAIRMNRINNRITSGAKLRGAFAPILAKHQLHKHSNLSDLDKMFRDELVSQAIAVEEFRPFIASKNKEAYQKAWEDYHKPPGAGGGIFFLEYTDEKVLKERIHAILKFTEK